MVTELHVESAGAGPCVLLAHGFAGSARNFRPQQRALRERYRVIAYDARGHGRSAAPAGPDAGPAYRLEAFVADMRRVLEAECATPDAAVVGGLSMGAATALHYALGRREALRGLVLAAPPGGRRAAGGISSHAREFADCLDAEGSEAAGERFVWGPGSRLDRAAAALVRQGFLEHAPHALSAILRGLLAELPEIDELAPLLQGLAVPTLVVVGSEDTASLGVCRRLAELLPAARLEVVEGAGHVVNLARPEAFNAVLLDFLQAL